MESRFRFTKVREVHSPTRNNEGDAGLDFYIPTNLTLSDLFNANSKAEDVSYSSKAVGEGTYGVIMSGGKISKIFIGPHTRILIPSGIKVLLEPKESMMQANNKSGRSTKQGLLFTAEVCDSPYTGEYHIGIYNSSRKAQELIAGEPIVQFVHVPVLIDVPEEISNKEYDKEAESWGTRGSKGFGSGDKDVK